VLRQITHKKGGVSHDVEEQENSTLYKSEQQMTDSWPVSDEVKKKKTDNKSGERATPCTRKTGAAFWH
jgi:hypothetical protein